MMRHVFAACLLASLAVIMQKGAKAAPPALPKVGGSEMKKGTETTTPEVTENKTMESPDAIRIEKVESPEQKNAKGRIMDRVEEQVPKEETLVIDLSQEKKVAASPKKMTTMEKMKIIQGQKSSDLEDGKNKLRRIGTEELTSLKPGKISSEEKKNQNAEHKLTSLTSEDKDKLQKTGEDTDGELNMAEEGKKKNFEQFTSEKKKKSVKPDPSIHEKVITTEDKAIIHNKEKKQQAAEEEEIKKHEEKVITTEDKAIIDKEDQKPTEENEMKKQDEKVKITEDKDVIDKKGKELKANEKEELKKQGQVNEGVKNPSVEKGKADTPPKKVKKYVIPVTSEQPKTPKPERITVKDLPERLKAAKKKLGELESAVTPLAEDIEKRESNCVQEVLTFAEDWERFINGCWNPENDEVLGACLEEEGELYRVAELYVAEVAAGCPDDEDVWHEPQ